MHIILIDSGHPYLIQLRTSRLLKKNTCFGTYNLFNELPTQEPASIICDEEQGDLSCSTGLYRNLP